MTKRWLKSLKRRLLFLYTWLVLTEVDRSLTRQGKREKA